MATYVGKVGEYDSSKETFGSYCDRMDMFFEANDLVVLGGAANAVADAAVVRKKRAIFLTELGADSFTLVNDLLAHVEVEPNAAPIFIKPRPVSYYMRSKLDAEYKRLQDTGIVEPVRYAWWASPAVPVLKRDGSVRVCGDYKVTVNKSLRKEVYPLPTPASP